MDDATKIEVLERRIKQLERAHFELQIQHLDMLIKHQALIEHHNKTTQIACIGIALIVKSAGGTVDVSGVERENFGKNLTLNVEETLGKGLRYFVTENNSGEFQINNIAAAMRTH